VIVETTDHSQAMALMSDAHVTDVLRTYKACYDELSLDPRIAHVTVFKNHGVDAGTSLEHPNSQLIAAPVISYQVRQRFSEALRHHDDFGVCMFCQMIEEELEVNERVVLVTEHFVGMEPFASPTPFCTHIRAAIWPASGTSARKKLPTSAAWCAPSWPSCTTASKTDFNLTVRTAPAECVGVKYFHWYLSIIPRLTRVAGFELGSGMFINTVLPEAAAEFLCNVKIETTVGAQQAMTAGAAE
jgi:UDPglucose--hexose-1-phosphate uridylyltransferase